MLSAVRLFLFARHRCRVVRGTQATMKVRNARRSLMATMGIFNVHSEKEEDRGRVTASGNDVRRE